VILDVDHFKSFNDSFGHLAGNEVLKLIADTLRATVRVSDFLARYGGEEFAVICPSTDAQGCKLLGERLRLAVQETACPYRKVSVTVGLATLEGENMNERMLVGQADEALYHGKKMGRNRCDHWNDLPHANPESPTSLTAA
jgi:diguanylate cyclase (GGDEF)-like protein